MFLRKKRLKNSLNRSFIFLSSIESSPFSVLFSRRQSFPIKFLKSFPSITFHIWGSFSKSRFSCSFNLSIRIPSSLPRQSSFTLKPSQSSFWFFTIRPRTFLSKCSSLLSPWKIFLLILSFFYVLSSFRIFFIISLPLRSKIFIQCDIIASTVIIKSILVPFFTFLNNLVTSFPIHSSDKRPSFIFLSYSQWQASSCPKTPLTISTLIPSYKIVKI